MVATRQLGLLLVLIDLCVRESHACRRERRFVVTDGDWGVGNGRVRGDVIAVVPIPSSNVVTFVQVDFEALILQFAVRNESPFKISSVTDGLLDSIGTHPTPAPMTATFWIGHLNWYASDPPENVRGSCWPKAERAARTARTTQPSMRFVMVVVVNVQTPRCLILWHQMGGGKGHRFPLYTEPQYHWRRPARGWRQRRVRDWDCARGDLQAKDSDGKEPSSVAGSRADGDSIDRHPYSYGCNIGTKRRRRGASERQPIFRVSLCSILQFQALRARLFRKVRKHGLG